MSVTVVYRSATDLKKAEFWYEEGPKMQERAINAEAEKAKLRAVVEAAREYMTVFDETPGYYESLDECVRLKEVLRRTLAELDEEGDD